MDPITVALHNSSSNKWRCWSHRVDSGILWEASWYRGVVRLFCSCSGLHNQLLVELLSPLRATICYPIDDDDADVNINKKPRQNILRCLFKNLSRFVLHEIGALAQNLHRLLHWWWWSFRFMLLLPQSRILRLRLLRCFDSHHIYTAFQDNAPHTLPW